MVFSPPLIYLAGGASWKTRLLHYLPCSRIAAWIAKEHDVGILHGTAIAVGTITIAPSADVTSVASSFNATSVNIDDAIRMPNMLGI